MSEDHGISFLDQIVELILRKRCIVGNPEWVKKNNPKLVHFLQPEELQRTLDLKIDDNPLNDGQLIELCEKVIQHSPLTSHPGFYNQLYGGVDQYSLAGSWLTDALNTSIATYEVSPVFSLMEKAILKYLSSKCGWNNDSIDGIFSPGGSISNMYGMACAKHKMFPEAKKIGIRHLKQLVLFVSDGSHYSYIKGSIMFGFGSDAIIKVPTDNQGKMIPNKLEELIQISIKNDQIPFMVGCTAGTTVLCAFDPLNEINVICKKYNLWMHVDACLGGTVLLSNKYKYLMSGIENANSLSWNTHKMTGAPLQSSIFIVQDKNVLSDSISLKAEYLFQSDKYYDPTYDLGDKSIQCGRKVDSFKNWIMLAAKGNIELERLVNKVFYIKDYLTEIIRKRKNFKLVLEKFEGNTVCFWYIPPSLWKNNFNEINMQKLNQVCPLIKKQMMIDGNIMVNYQPLTSKALPNFFRMVLTCVPEPTESEMDFLVEEIEKLGQNLVI